jgi:hypothetical protein
MNANPDGAVKTNASAPVPDLQLFLGRLGSGEAVYERRNSHMSSHPVPEALLSEAFARIVACDRPFLVEQVDFNRTIGATTCVTIGANDEVLFARRREGEGLTPFVRGRVAEPASSVVIILKRFDDFFVLVTAFIGVKAEPLPWNSATLDRAADPLAAYERSVVFWNSHALLWGSEAVSQDTVTDVRPW